MRTGNENQCLGVARMKVCRIKSDPLKIRTLGIDGPGHRPSDRPYDPSPEGQYVLLRRWVARQPSHGNARGIVMAGTAMVPPGMNTTHEAMAFRVETRSRRGAPLPQVLPHAASARRVGCAGVAGRTPETYLEP